MTPQRPVPAPRRARALSLPEPAAASRRDGHGDAWSSPFGFGDVDDGGEEFVVIPPPPRSRPESSHGGGSAAVGVAPPSPAHQHRVVTPTTPPQSAPHSPSPARALSGHANHHTTVRRGWDASEGFGFSLSDARPGLVTAVLPRLGFDAADGDGLEAGDVIVRVNRVECGSGVLPTARRLVAAAAGRDVELEVRRAGVVRPTSAHDVRAEPNAHTRVRNNGSPPRSPARPVQVVSPAAGAAQLIELDRNHPVPEHDVAWDGAAPILERRGSNRSASGRRPSVGARDSPSRRPPSDVGSGGGGGGGARQPVRRGSDGGPLGERPGSAPPPSHHRPQPRSRVHPQRSASNGSSGGGERDWQRGGARRPESPCDGFDNVTSDSDEEEDDADSGLGASHGNRKSVGPLQPPLPLTRGNLDELQRALSGGDPAEMSAPRARTCGRLSGWLQCETVPGAWVNRWAKLSAHELLLFSSSLEVRPLGVVALLGATVRASAHPSSSVTSAAMPSVDERFWFEVVPTAGPATLLSTPRWDERQTWMRALRRAAVRTEDMGTLERKELENRIEKELFEQCGTPTAAGQYVSVARKLAALKLQLPAVNPSDGSVE
jgi:hypothetical protein